MGFSECLEKFKKKNIPFTEFKKKKHEPLNKNQNGHTRLGLWVGKSMKSQHLRVTEATEGSNHKTVKTNNAFPQKQNF